MNKIVVVLLMLFFGFLFSQETETIKLKKYKISVLSDSLRETSGLSFLHNQLYSFNDGGNTSEIFRINPENGSILEKTNINTGNNDWEAITNDGEYFYIGDFGNNQGTRKNLRILKINPNKKVTEISFYYPEQTNFTPQNISHNFDCEAMIFLNGKLHLFTKEWQSKAVTHYVVDPTIKELQPAKKIESFPIDYVVTDATFFDNRLYLIGYTKKTKVYLSTFKIKENGLFFGQRERFYKLGNTLKLSQIEGITANEKGLYISGERFITPISNVPPTLYFIPYDKFVDKIK